jgi:hypothetical protein
MRMAYLFVAALLAIPAVSVSALDPATASKGANRFVQDPDPFEDVDPVKYAWVYQALENLHKKGILNGYPDGKYRGLRTLTRYELAVALDRAIQLVLGQGGGQPGPEGPRGPAGPVGPAGGMGERGPRGMVDPAFRLAEQDLRQLIDAGRAFRGTLAQLDRSVTALGQRVGTLRTRIDNLQDYTPYGGVFIGIRGDRADGEYVDRDGRIFGSFPGAPNLTNSPIVLNQFNFGLKTRINDGGVLDSQIVFNNYFNYLNDSTAFVWPQVDTRPDSNVNLDILNYSVPVEPLGRGGNLTIGRFRHRCTRLTLWRPDVDSYFGNSFLDDNFYRMDGVRIDTRIGSVNTSLFGGRFDSVRGAERGPWNSPLAGASMSFPNDTPPLFLGNNKPFGNPFIGQMEVRKLAGVRVDFPITLPRFGAGKIGGTVMDMSGNSFFGAGDFNNVWVYGADVNLRLSDRLSFEGEWAKTDTGTGRFATVNDCYNQAFTGNVGYMSGNLNVQAGYKYIDPLFYAPGYWDKIGNWYNPTNIQGPTFRAGYDFSPNLGISVGGEFYGAARNREPVSLGREDCVNRIRAGVRWDVAKNFRTTLDWEGVFWSLDNVRFGGTGLVHPTENYFTIGTGYNLTNNTTLKLAYQIGDYDGHGSVGGGTGFSRYNFNTFTGSLAIRY